MKIEEQIIKNRITYLSSPLKSRWLIAELQFDDSQKHMWPFRWTDEIRISSKSTKEKEEESLIFHKKITKQKTQPRPLQRSAAHFGIRIVLSLKHIERVSTFKLSKDRKAQPLVNSIAYPCHR